MTLAGHVPVSAHAETKSGGRDGAMKGFRKMCRKAGVFLLFLVSVFLFGCAGQREEMSCNAGGQVIGWGFLQPVCEGAGKIFTTYTAEMREPLPKEEFARVKDYIPDIIVELKYAGNDNFTGAVIYDFTDAYLRYGTIEKLKHVQEEVMQYGYSLKIWDAFRPVSAQFKLWEICPIPKYVANPYGGYSSHSKGNTVDITLVNQNGSEIELPTGFDDFSDKADRDYSDCTEEAAGNARYLEEAMQRNGFVPYSGEWWHFEDGDNYPVEEVFSP